MRELTSHKTNGVNEALVIEVMDDPGPGGAHHVYDIDIGPGADVLQVKFQKGPLNEAGVNGVTHEALLAILIDRLECFQAGAYACDENAVALAHLSTALNTLKNRTAKRIARGVEGTSTI